MCDKIMRVNNWIERHPFISIAILFSIPFLLHALTLVLI